SLQRERPSCWPVDAPVLSKAFPEIRDLVACWPMDMDSLLQGYEEGTAPAAAILGQAVAPGRWEETGCSDYDHRDACPFYQNARWLRGEREAKGLLRILRRQELATGQRWNFRS